MLYALLRIGYLNVNKFPETPWEVSTDLQVARVVILTNALITIWNWGLEKTVNFESESLCVWTELSLSIISRLGDFCVLGRERAFE